MEDRERVTCAVELLRSDARIWWSVVPQLKDVHTMYWTEFQKVFGERYFSNAFKEVTPATVEFQRGGGPNDHKRKLLGTSIANDDKKARDNNQGRQNKSEKWREYPLCEKCRRRHLSWCRPRRCHQCGNLGHIKRDCPQLSRGDIVEISGVALLLLYDINSVLTTFVVF